MPLDDLLTSELLRWESNMAYVEYTDMSKNCQLRVVIVTSRERRELGVRLVVGDEMRYRGEFKG